MRALDDLALELAKEGYQGDLVIHNSDLLRCLSKELTGGSYARSDLTLNTSAGFAVVVHLDQMTGLSSWVAPMNKTYAEALRDLRTTPTKKGCQCDIHQLMRSGHDKGCEG